MVFMEDLDYRTSAKGLFGKHMRHGWIWAIQNHRQVCLLETWENMP